MYHHNGKKWEKQGYEGSMFLYERCVSMLVKSEQLRLSTTYGSDSYPPYGFYILNRMGMGDYIQQIYPEDDIGAHGSYLMLSISISRSRFPPQVQEHCTLAHLADSKVPTWINHR